MKKGIIKKPFTLIESFSNLQAVLKSYAKLNYCSFSLLILEKIAVILKKCKECPVKVKSLACYGNIPQYIK